MDESPLTPQIIRDTALRFGLAWDAAWPVPELAQTPQGIRIGAILDHLRHPAGKMLKRDTAVMLGAFTFYPAESYLKKDETVTRLTEKERDVLLVLLEAEGQIIPRDLLLHKVWGYASSVETHTLETHIYRLRQKLGDTGTRPTILLTAGEGYRIAAE